MNVNIASHLLHPDTPATVVSYHGVRHIEVSSLLQTSRNLQEELCLDLLGGCEGDEHVVTRGHNALWSGEVVDRNILDQAACSVGTITYLQYYFQLRI